MQLKFERQAAEKAEGGDGGGGTQIRLFVRLDFSDYEKLSYTRWLERIPAEAPFKGLPVEIVLAKDEGFSKTEDLFASLK